MTAESSKRTTSVLDSNSCLVWLDRCYKDLLQWKRTLESYLFEPTTQRQFELKQRLTDAMERLLNRYRELATVARNNNKLVGNQVELIKNYMIETRKLEDGVQEYIVMLHQAS
ncbi:MULTISPECIES: hypothetical protein [Maribacter]|uniref:Uncharacterized protein n=1 Tax=Maribacter flavus TaxID=1658664 RepID=A0A5B2TQT8_9FLAO|nr:MULTISPECIES: hypothetical protein [Maribacter]KAA2216981.1 hypothetical protein F0361_13420 [Maribacter flavus]MDC6405628.1 hypothetical protein [Maribacter sp. PR66]MEE1972604.1 hypothetical protein [Maribacter flavus]